MLDHGRKRSVPSPRALASTKGSTRCCQNSVIGTSRCRFLFLVPRMTTTLRSRETSPRWARSVALNSALVSTMNATLAARSGVSWSSSRGNSS